MILDTSYLLDLFAGDEAAFERGTTLQEHGTLQRVPVPVVMELQYGVEISGSAEERRNVRNALRLYPMVRLDAEMARYAGSLLARADRDADGESGVEKLDAMIAAVAEVLNEPVLTDNTRDFCTLGTAVETY